MSGSGASKVIRSAGRTRAATAGWLATWREATNYPFLLALATHPFGGGFVYVSRGVGGVELPIRTFSPPEIMLLEFARPTAVDTREVAQPRG
jgi:hypothetical protein